MEEKVRTNDIQSRELANAIRERLQLDDDNDQDILDQHVSRVFSDLTPAKSPGIISPRPHSPTRNRYIKYVKLINNNVYVTIQHAELRMFLIINSVQPKLVF